MIRYFEKIFSPLKGYQNSAVTCSGHLGHWYRDLAAQTLAPKNTFQVFFLQLYFNRKHMEVAINDFTMHLIISEMVLMTKMKTKEKKQ